MSSPVVTSFEASLAPHEGDLLSLPFDQYGRMRVAQNCLHALYDAIAGRADDGRRTVQASEGGDDGRDDQVSASGYRLRVLDVGGYPGILRHFLDARYFDVSVLDVVPDDGTVPQYTYGSGMDLPFEDGSFDVVTALDTLEHIPHTERDRFLAEMIRVARHGVLLINPVQSVEADLAEETLNEYIKWVLDAQQEQLAEHREYGLPNFTHTIGQLTGAGWEVATFTTANVYNWLLMMVAKHYLISMRDEKATAFERTLDRFYNLTFSDSDMTEPAYRGVLVAVRPELEGALHLLRAKYPPPVQSESANALRLGLAQTLMAMLNLKLDNHEDRKLREQMENRDQHIAALEQKVAILDIQVDQRNVEIKSLQAQSDGMRRSLQDQADSLRLELQSYIEHSKNLEVLGEQTRQAYSVEFERQAEYISRLEEDMRGKDEHIRYLETLLQGIESGRVMRLTRALSRFLGK